MENKSQNTMSSSGRNKTLAAFTLLELLVGMIVSGIVLASAFSAWRIVSRQVRTYDERIQAAGELSFFISRFESEVMRAARMTPVSTDALRLELNSRLLTYRFHEKYVLRAEDLHTDTFFVQVKMTGTFFHGAKIPVDEDADEIRLGITLDGKREEKSCFVMRDVKREMDRLEKEITKD
jgi:type II secretory pathway pseudopilin PulG